MLLAAAAYTQSQFITVADLPDMITRTAASTSGVATSRRQVLDNTEADLVVQALQQAGSMTQPALRLGLHEATLYRKVKEYGVPYRRIRTSTDGNCVRISASTLLYLV